MLKVTKIPDLKWRISFPNFEPRKINFIGRVPEKKSPPTDTRPTLPSRMASIPSNIFAGMPYTDDELRLVGEVGCILSLRMAFLGFLVFSSLQALANSDKPASAIFYELYQKPGAPLAHMCKAYLSLCSLSLSLSLSLSVSVSVSVSTELYT